MSSEAQIVAKGRNAIEHGIDSQIKVLYNEHHADYNDNTQVFIAKFQPQDDVERRLVERIADCEWRLIRALYIETATVDLQVAETAELIVETFETIQEPARVAYENVQRQEARLHRHYERAYKTLPEIQKETHKKYRKTKPPSSPTSSTCSTNRSSHER